MAAFHGVTPDYVTAMGIPLRAGRNFTAADDENGQKVALVNEEFVRRYVNGDPLGRIVYVNGRDGTPHVVVGVVADVRHRRLDTAARPALLVPYVQLDPAFVTAFGRGLSVVVQTDVPMATASASTPVCSTKRAASSGSARTISLLLAPPSSDPPIVPSSPSTETARSWAYSTTRRVTATFSSKVAGVTWSPRMLPSIITLVNPAAIARTQSS